MGATGRRTRRQKRARGVGLQVPTGTWGSGRGKQDSEHRGGRWRPAGVDACPGGQAVQDWKRGENRVQRSVQLSLRVTDGGGVGARRVKKKDPENSWTVGRG